MLGLTELTQFHRKEAMIGSAIECKACGSVAKDVDACGVEGRVMQFLKMQF